MKAHVAVANLVATWFGCGLSPIAPGTLGALGALPLFVVLAPLGDLAYWSIVIALSALGIWAAQVVSVSRNEKDPQRVVIDEVAGILIALGFVRERELVWQLAALVAFRLLDIYKPGPIASAERLPPHGFGIMADDLLAGLVAGLTLSLL